MKIIVCIKQVPDTNEVKINPKTGTLIREGVPSIINPDDKNALEESLVLKDKYGAAVTVITMGPPQADFALREALAMGADEAVLLSDRAFAGADTAATSLALACAVKKIGQYDLIFCGHQAIDGDTAQVGPELAEHLNLPQVTYVRKVISIDREKIIVERSMEDGFEIIECRLPALLTAVKELNTPRYPSVYGIEEAFGIKKTLVWDAGHIQADPEKMGLKGSPTQVIKTFTPPAKEKGRIMQGNPKEITAALVHELREKHLL